MTPRTRIAANGPTTGLYLITPDEADTRRLLALVDQALRAPVAMLQYRNKTADAALRAAQAMALRSLCGERGVRFIVNDDAALALAVGADGVHVGRDDAGISQARDLLGEDAIIGASCYADLQRAQIAIGLGADYLAFGAMFASASKPQAPLAPASLLRDARRFALPIVAIGGITPSHVATLLGQGADYLAVIHAVFGAESPRRAVELFHDEFKKHEDRIQEHHDQPSAV